MAGVLAGAIFVSLALVVDGGRALGALTEAQDIADNAARAGAQAVDMSLWRDGGRPTIEAESIVEAKIDQFMVESRLNQRVDTWTVVTALGPDADITVSVQVWITPPGFFFPARTMSAVGSATALDGVTGP